MSERGDRALLTDMQEAMRRIMSYVVGMTDDALFFNP